MNTIPDPVTILRRKGEGKSLRAFGGQLEFFLTGAETGGWLSAAVLDSPPENGPPPHIHHNEDEILIVLEGTFSFFADGAWTEGGPGTSVFLPRGKPHCFRNVGGTPGRLMVMANPAGLETFFDQCEEPFYQEGGPDMERITAIGAAHGIQFV